MSMEINGSWRHYETNYAQQMNAAQRKAKEPEKCTGSTDRVDREIEKLKEQKKQLEQQIKISAGDEERTRAL